MAKAIQISDAEWSVMNVVWEMEPVTAADVIQALAPTHQWNHRTIRTLLARLVEKEVLTFDMDGARYIYRSVISRRRCVRHESRSFLSKVFGGDVGALLTHFVDDAPMSEDELKELRRLLAAKQSRTRKQ